MVDATLGLGGHAGAILASFPGRAWSGWIATTTHWRRARRGSRVRTRTTLVHAVYDELPEVLDRLGLAKVDGVLLDLGVSSLQLDKVGRGFSYAGTPRWTCGWTNRRTDRGRRREHLPTDRLAQVIASYGEERFARRIAQRVVRERAPPDRDHSQLADLVLAAVPAAPGTARADTRRDGRSRPCGSRSTVSSTRWPARCRPRSRRSPSAVASSRSPTTHWRTAS